MPNSNSQMVWEQAAWLASLLINSYPDWSIYKSIIFPSWLVSLLINNIPHPDWSVNLSIPPMISEVDWRQWGSKDSAWLLYQHIPPMISDIPEADWRRWDSTDSDWLVYCTIQPMIFDSLAHLESWWYPVYLWLAVSHCFHWRLAARSGQGGCE